MSTKLSRILTLILAFVVQFTFAQEKTISGTVMDDQGLPLPGVNILIQGTTQGTQTNFDGDYSIDAEVGETLVFSYIGFKEQNIEVGASNTIDVNMAASASKLDEVVITALGIERKPKELSYSIATVDNEALTQTRNVSAATAMVGKVSGLQINTTNSGVNPSSRVVLRGNRSLLNNNEALIVVDGFQTDGGSALEQINPNDIEEVSVLKGGNAAALYGSDAANGVIIITTKKGEGKMNVTFTTSSELSQVAFLPDTQDEFGVGGFPDGTLRPLENVNYGPRFDGRMIKASETLADGSALMVPYSPIDDHFENFYDTGLSVRNSVQVSSGDENGSYLFSLDQTNTEGIVPQDAYNQTNARVNTTRQLGKLSVKSTFSFFRSHQNVVGINNDNSQARPLSWYVLNTPAHVPFDTYRNYKDGPKFLQNEASYFRFYENPYFVVDNNRRMSDRNKFTFINRFNYEFTDYLSASLNVGYKNDNFTRKITNGRFTYDFHVPDPYAELGAYGAQTSEYESISRRLNSDFIISLDKDLGEDFNISANLGQNVQVEEFKRLSVGGNNLVIPGFFDVSTRTGQLNSGNFASAEFSSNNRKFSIYGDLTLGYKDYLYLSASGRNDWTSTLPEQNRSFFYPSAGFSFVATNAFPEIKGTLNYLKGSFSYAKVGNDPGAYVTSETFSQGFGFPFGDTPGLNLSNRSADPDLKPEFTTSYEGSIEFGFFEGERLSGSVTAYQTNTTDQLTPIQSSFASGATSFYTNVGEIENQGLELDLNVDVIRSEDFTWNLGGHYTSYKSEVISLADGADELEIGGTATAVIKAKVGEPYPLIKTNVYQRDDQGRVIVDASGDPQEASGLEFQGKTTPDYTVGLNTTFTYKNFELYAVADYRTGHVFYNNLADALEFTGLTQHSVTSNRQPFVYPNSSYADGNGGFTANTSRPTSGAGSSFWGTTFNDVKSNYVTDATALKLREVSLSYKFNKNAINNLGLDNLKLNLYGRNLFIVRPAQNVYADPEHNFTTGNAIGIGSQSQTPNSSTYGLALTAQF
jgi:TonB-linked SusC/RagA family outer membrane protein